MHHLFQSYYNEKFTAGKDVTFEKGVEFFWWGYATNEDTASFLYSVIAYFKGKCYRAWKKILHIEETEFRNVCVKSNRTKIHSGIFFLPLIMCHNMSFVPCYLLCVTCHLTTTLCSFTCYESPTTFGDVAVGGLMIDREKKKKID